MLGFIIQAPSMHGGIMLFLVNGEAYLGQDCCDAIRIIERQCWPSMLGSLGFTSEEGDILHGYCDASESSSIPERHHYLLIWLHK
ncbi:hypothetical protein RDI58_026482 [Solanum bulbocastanum]|uniref:Prolamin-like domain-containing protein n=1 Tax=Solanum bulbocastanum TaxID=147425 RepID=A0AAN8Y174_SOLBU